jgi:hypothetical protein
VLLSHAAVSWLPKGGTDSPNQQLIGSTAKTAAGIIGKNVQIHSVRFSCKRFRITGIAGMDSLLVAQSCPVCHSVGFDLQNFSAGFPAEKFGGLVGDTAPTRRTPGRAEKLKRSPSNHRFRTAGSRKFMFGRWVGLGKSVQVNLRSTESY